MKLKTQDLQSIAQKLQDTHLFTGVSDFDRWQHKQRLFLVAAGSIPSCLVSSKQCQETPTGRTLVADDPGEVTALLDELGVVYKFIVDRHAVDVVVAQTEELLLDCIATRIHPNIAPRFFDGAEIPTAVRKRHRKQSADDPALSLKDHFNDDRIIGLFGDLPLPRQGYLTRVKSAIELLQKYGLLFDLKTV